MVAGTQSQPEALARGRLQSLAHASGYENLRLGELCYTPSSDRGKIGARHWHEFVPSFRYGLETAKARKVITSR